MLAVTGFRTTIVRELAKLIDDPVVRINADLSKFDAPLDIPPANRFVLAAGVLWQRRVDQQSAGEIVYSLAVNMVNTVKLCEQILATNSVARIVIIGSESAERGSYDQTYALSKAGVHAYAQWREVLPAQQLTVIAPPIISDAGMTLARRDYPCILAKRRTVTSRQVAEKVKALLYDAPPGSHGVELC